MKHGRLCVRLRSSPGWLFQQGSSPEQRYKGIKVWDFHGDTTVGPLPWEVENFSLYRYISYSFIAKKIPSLQHIFQVEQQYNGLTKIISGLQKAWAMPKRDNGARILRKHCCQSFSTPRILLRVSPATIITLSVPDITEQDNM